MWQHAAAHVLPASVVKSVTTAHLKCAAERLAGSSPARGTIRVDRHRPRRPANAQFDAGTPRRSVASATRHSPSVAPIESVTRPTTSPTQNP